MYIANKIKLDQYTTKIMIYHESGRIITEEGPILPRKVPTTRIYDMMPNYVVEEIDQFAERENMEAEFSKYETLYLRV